MKKRRKLRETVQEKVTGLLIIRLGSSDKIDRQTARNRKGTKSQSLSHANFECCECERGASNPPSSSVDTTHRSIYLL